MRLTPTFYFLLLPAAFGQTQSVFGILPNSGQLPAAIQFFHPGTHDFFYVTRDSFVLSNAIRVQIGGIDAGAAPVPVSLLPTIYNFYQGNNPSQWMPNVPSYGGVKLNNAYPGISAEFTTTAIGLADRSSVDLGRLIFTISPGADSSPVRIRVLNTGTTPVNGPGGIWFTGGNVQGVFQVSAEAAQPAGTTSTAVTCTLQIESSSDLSIQLPDRNPALETDVVITFPDNSALTTQTAGAGFVTSTIQYPSSFGQDGSLPASTCRGSCRKAVVARLDTSGRPVWVTVFGGAGDDDALFATPVSGGVAVSGNTTSRNFPVTAGAPYAAPGSNQDVFLAYFDVASGQLRAATYAGLPATAGVSEQAALANGDIAAGGLYADSTSSGGYVLRWQPAGNRFVYRVLTDSPVVSLASDANPDVFVATLQTQASAPVISVSEFDPSGKAAGSPVRVTLPVGSQPGTVLLQPSGGAVWLAYSLGGSGTWVANVSPAAGAVLFQKQAVLYGQPANIGVTPSGNLKLLVEGAGLTETTTPDAPLVAGCASTNYFVIFGPAGGTVFATYVPAAGFDFASQNESTGPPPAAVSCIAETAGRVPVTAAAPGELITITGGGFGPLVPAFSVPGSSGIYPTTSSGLSVKIGGLDAPIIATARGLIAVQVPFEVLSSQPAQPVEVEVTQNTQPLNPMPIFIAASDLGFFGTFAFTSSAPILAALNQDGSVNGPDNPAAAGSVVSIFGSGAGVLSPPVPTGGLNPIPPAGQLSIPSFDAVCGNCTVLYFGSAPGLSSGVFQLNLQLPAGVPGSGLRTEEITVYPKSAHGSVGTTGAVYVR